MDRGQPSRQDGPPLLPLLQPEHQPLRQHGHPHPVSGAIRPVHHQHRPGPPQRRRRCTLHPIPPARVGPPGSRPARPRQGPRHARSRPRQVHHTQLIRLPPHPRRRGRHHEGDRHPHAVRRPVPACPRHSALPRPLRTRRRRRRGWRVQQGRPALPPGAPLPVPAVRAAGACQLLPLARGAGALLRALLCRHLVRLVLAHPPRDREPGRSQVRHPRFCDWGRARGGEEHGVSSTDTSRSLRADCGKGGRFGLVGVPTTCPGSGLSILDRVHRLVLRLV
mmetsp:Transcript_50802/g.106151  ORF Transcript_50802/g.106151 Transcript_50802/m.106151 type:complete len:278 (-) Transcript_50802:254-1087(-)